MFRVVFLQIVSEAMKKAPTIDNCMGFAIHPDWGVQVAVTYPSTVPNLKLATRFYFSPTP